MLTWGDLQSDPKNAQLPLGTDVLGPLNKPCEIFYRFRDVPYAKRLRGRLEQWVLGLGCSGCLQTVHFLQ